MVEEPCLRGMQWLRSKLQPLFLTPKHGSSVRRERQLGMVRSVPTTPTLPRQGGRQFIARWYSYIAETVNRLATNVSPRLTLRQPKGFSRTHERNVLSDRVLIP